MFSVPAYTFPWKKPCVILKCIVERTLNCPVMWQVQLPPRAVVEVAQSVGDVAARVSVGASVALRGVLDEIVSGGQNPRLAFRYWMDCTVNGFVVYVDKVQMLGTIGINPIGSNIPREFALHQNYPNPFNPTTKIKFDIPRNTDVTLEVYNSLGQVVQTLYKGYANAGYYETDFNASGLPSGAYFYRLVTRDFTQVKKMMLVK